MIKHIKCTSCYFKATLDLDKSEYDVLLIQLNKTHLGNIIEVKENIYDKPIS